MEERWTNYPGSVWRGYLNAHPTEVQKIRPAMSGNLQFTNGDWKLQRTKSLRLTFGKSITFQARWLSLLAGYHWKGPIWGCTSHRQERRKVSSEQLLPPSLTQSKQCMTQTDRNMVRNDPSIPALMTKLTRLFDSAILIKRLLTSGFHFTASVLQGRCLIC